MAFGSFESGSTARPMADINTTPLVDVMLVLMIIFLVTAPMMTQSIKVDLPQANGEPINDEPKVAQLALDAEGRVFWDSQPVSDDVELLTRLQSAAEQKPQPELQLSADKDTRYQRLAELMSAIRASGLTKMGFVTVPQGVSDGQPRK